VQQRAFDVLLPLSDNDALQHDAPNDFDAYLASAVQTADPKWTCSSGGTHIKSYIQPEQVLLDDSALFRQHQCSLSGVLGFC